MKLTSGRFVRELSLDAILIAVLTRFFFCRWGTLAF